MKLENRFLVLKWADIDGALTPYEQDVLQDFLKWIERYRTSHGKKQNSYVVINQDEPYFPEVLKLMEEAERKKAGQA